MGNPVQGGAVATPTINHYHSTAAWIEGRAIDQAVDVSKWKGVTAVATFPDLHPGRFGPVGAAVLADRIYPQLIGGDIGCGMAVFRLNLKRRKLRLDKAAKQLRKLGRVHDPADDLPADYQGEIIGLGTIGGGNHFCELQEVVELPAPVDGLSKGDLVLMVHSGSRGYGAGLFRRIEAVWNDGFGPLSVEGQDYLAIHKAAVEFARLNRSLIAQRAARALKAEASLLVDASHNELARYRNLWLHRKGAAGLQHPYVPLAGSRDSYSYLMRPCEDAPVRCLASMAHGAGRKFDRASMHGRVRSGRADIQQLSRNTFGGYVICEDKTLIVEEAGLAYKSVCQVAGDLEMFGIATQAAKLRPLLTFKKVRDND